MDFLTSTTTTGLPPQDWQALFQAVNARLQRCAEFSPGQDHAPRGADALRTQVLECVQALTTLQAQVADEHARHAAALRDLARAEAKAAELHHELATARAGERVALRQAQHDSLTRLPNRDGFNQRLQQELLLTHAQLRDPVGSTGPSLAVLYLDLDGLKPINDQHGHHAGDQLLRIVGARLARAVRKEDMVCRMGGDEFACLLTEVKSRQHLSHLACKLFDAVSAPLKIGLLQLTVRPSIGIAVCPTDGATAQGLLRHADSAMYRAKRRQLGYAFFDAEHDGQDHHAPHQAPALPVSPRSPAPRPTAT